MDVIAKHKNSAGGKGEGHVQPQDTHLQGCHPHHLVAVIEEVWQDIENRCFRQDEFLEGTETGLIN